MYIYQVVFFAVDPAVDVVEGLAAERAATGAADEAVGVVEVPHRLARLPGTRHLLTACVTDTCNTSILSVVNYVFSIQLLLTRVRVFVVTNKNTLPSKNDRSKTIFYPLSTITNKTFM